MTAMTPDKVEAALATLRWLVHGDGRLSELDMSMPEALSVLAEALAESRRDAARYRKIRQGRSDYHGDCYAMTFDEEGDYPVDHEHLDELVDAMKDTDHAR